MSAPIFEFYTAARPVSVMGLYARFGKRVFDILVVLLILPLALPLMALLLALTACSGGNPFYCQTRVGLGACAFRFWKIRTMVPRADAALDRLLAGDPALAQEWAVNQKLVQDPRITRLGAFLRKTSLDELPQLWNVLNGTMSLVGPRPFLPDQVELYLNGSPDAAYYGVRPGLTGLWQVSLRSAGSFAERAAYDSDYCSRITLLGDISILWRTLFAVFRGTGR
jgi:lipopolysaccharide/colanic/teichoic acid biosynthesis glycosyltransferase